MNFVEMTEDSEKANKIAVNFELVTVMRQTTRGCLIYSSGGNLWHVKEPFDYVMQQVKGQYGENGRQDAERYRWLRSQVASLQRMDWLSFKTAEELDAAIDNARSRS